MRSKRKNNFAFIDGQNLNLGMRSLGWKLDYKRFRVYLAEKYNVTRAYMFIGFVVSNQQLYDTLERAGFILRFKVAIPDGEGKIKGNIDADLVLLAMIELSMFDKAVIVSNDGDFYSLVRHLYEEDKLQMVLSSSYDKCSSLLRENAKDRINFLQDLRNRLEYT